MLVFDIETDDLLEKCENLWCLSIYDTDTDTLDSYDIEKGNLDEGIQRLQNADKICGHNIIDFDIPALEKLKGFKCKEEAVIDTLVLSRLIYSDLDVKDIGLMKQGRLPSRLYKSHSLKAWGFRLGILKGTYGEKEEAWKVFNKEMLEYNKQDVRVTVQLYNRLAYFNYSQRAIQLEHEVQWLISKMCRNGVKFDIQKARDLEVVLRTEYNSINTELQKLIPKIPDKVFIPKRSNKAKGYVAGVPFQKYKIFNAESRQQIEYVLRKVYKYKLFNRKYYNIKEDNDSLVDNYMKYPLKIDEETFNYILEDKKATDEVKHFVELEQKLLVISKRLGQLADGKQAWLKYFNEKDGCIHGRIITNGAVSGRATHSNPNLAQVPAINVPFGKECRELFTSGDWIQVGIDACGLELRCLAHFLYPYDEGEYAHEILNGDIHTKNQKNAGLETRQQAKRFIYAFLFGAGDEKIGEIIGCSAEEGRKVKNKFLNATPSIKNLKRAITDTLVSYEFNPYTHRSDIHWKRHYLRGLDKRRLHVRSPHSALNLLLQSAGALICKKWIVLTNQLLQSKGV